MTSILWELLNWLANFEIAVATLIVIGLIGVLLHQKLMNAIVQKYQDSKYKMINAFSQDN